MKKAKLAVEILVMMIVAVLTTATLLYLIQAGVVEVKNNPNQQEVLDIDLFSVANQGYLDIREFEFCGGVNQNYQCAFPGNEFYPGDEVHFKFLVNINTFQDQIKLIENYRIKDSDGVIILDVDLSNNFHFDYESKSTMEVVKFKDFFTIGEDVAPGTYTLDLIIEDSFSGKKITSFKEFIIVEEYEDEYEEDEY